jgi:hypothetical protein
LVLHLPFDIVVVVDTSSISRQRHPFLRPAGRESALAVGLLCAVVA